MDKEQKRLTPNAAKPKIEAYCAYQPRCQNEVMEKLYSFGLSSEDANQLLFHVVKMGLVNDETYAVLFAGSKLRQNHWGKIKIKLALKQKQMTDYCIKKALNSLDEEQYSEILEKEALKYARTLKDKLYYIKQQKLSKHLISKGFETDLSFEIAKSIFQDKKSNK